MPEKSPIKFWKGSDIRTAPYDMQLRPGFNLVPLAIPSDGLPFLPPEQLEELLKYRPTMRSRYAQIGLDIDEDILRRILHSSRMNPSALSGSNQFIESTGMLINHTVRPINLPASVQLFRLFRSFTPPLTDRELTSAIKDGKIQIDGKQGVDWDLEQPTNANQGITGVNVVIDPHRTWIPKGRKPVQISDTNRKFRQEVDRWHRSIEDKSKPDPNQQILWVGQTPTITLSDDIEGVLDHIAFPNLNTVTPWNMFGTHIKSHLIDAGSSWPIRVEILSPTHKEAMPNFVTFYFYKNS